MWWGFEEERERGTSRDFLQPVCVCETVSEMGSRLSLLTVETEGSYLEERGRGVVQHGPGRGDDWRRDVRGGERGGRLREKTSFLLKKKKRIHAEVITDALKQRRS